MDLTQVWPAIRQDRDDRPKVHGSIPQGCIRSLRRFHPLETDSRPPRRLGDYFHAQPVQASFGENAAYGETMAHADPANGAGNGTKGPPPRHKEEREYDGASRRDQ